MPKPMDLSGKRFGYLTAVRLSKNRKHNCRLWVCECDCGNVIEVRVADLVNGNTKSCGCYQKERARNAKTKHGYRSERLYGIWCNMKSRCSNQKTKSYKNYGGRGITVCDEWSESFTSFRKWALENGYSNGLTIERVDVNKGYSPENCSFIPKSEQSRNTRRCHFVTYKGETKTLSEWSNELHFGRTNFRNKRKYFDTDEETIDYILSKKNKIGA